MAFTHEVITFCFVASNNGAMTLYDTVTCSTYSSHLLQEGATSLSVLRSVWQTYWLYQNWGWSDNIFDRLEQSLVELKHKFPDLLQQLIEAGWNTNNLSLKVPKEMSIEELPAL